MVEVVGELCEEELVVEMVLLVVGTLELVVIDVLVLVL